MRYLFFLFTIIISNTASAQKRTEVFQLSTPTKKVEQSLFNKFSIIDIREDTSTIGIVQKGMFNSKAKLVCEPSLEKQLITTFDSLITSNAQNTELVLLLQELNFVEATYALKELGMLHVRGVFFAKQQDKYCKLVAHDTLMIVQSMDVTKGLLKKGSTFIIDLLTNVLTTTPTTFNIDNLSYIINYDSLQKIQFPLYTTTTYKNGAYKDFQSLLYQQPTDSNINIDFYKSGHWKSVQLKNKKGKRLFLIINYLFLPAYTKCM
jgi:hypothetical protein